MEIATRRRRATSLRPLRRPVWGSVLLAAGLVAAVAWGPTGSAGDPPRLRLAVLPFEIKDTSGEVGAPDRHDARLARLTRYVGAQIAAAEMMDVVDQARVGAAVTANNPGTYLRSCNGCERDIARSVGADSVMVGWVYKVSSLVLSLHVVVKDVATGKVLHARVFDFRGDNEKAWKRAAGYMVAALSKQIETISRPTN